MRFAVTLVFFKLTTIYSNQNHNTHIFKAMYANDNDPLELIAETLTREEERTRVISRMNKCDLTFKLGR